MKENQWHFGLEVHIGVDARTGLTHTFITTAANEHEINQAKNLLHGDENFIFGDADFRGAEKREELKDVAVDWHIEEWPGKVSRLKKHPRINIVAIIKCQFGLLRQATVA